MPAPDAVAVAHLCPFTLKGPVKFDHNRCIGEEGHYCDDSCCEQAVVDATAARDAANEAKEEALREAIEGMTDILICAKGLPGAMAEGSYRDLLKVRDAARAKAGA